MSLSKPATSMESLPVDAVEVLCRYLSERDIAACSKVSRSWRELLNEDVIWKPHCSTRKQLEEQLRTTPCAVQPPFAITDSPNSSLSSPCPWKIANLREKHLRNNIQEGRFKETPINYDERKGFPCACGFLSDDLVYLMFKTSIEVWNVREDPAVKFSEMCRKWTEDERKSFAVVGEDNDIAMINKGFMIAVFTIDFQKGLLKAVHGFRFNGGERRYFRRNLNDVPKHVVIGSTFIGVNRARSSKLHVWDLKHGSKICEDKVETSGFCVVDILGSQSTSNVIIVSAPENQEFVRKSDTIGSLLSENRKFEYMVYSSTETAFLEFKDVTRSTNGYSCAILKDFVAVFDNSLRIFNYKTSELILQGNGGFEFYHTSSKVVAVGDYFIRISPFIVQVFHPETKSSFVDLGTITCSFPGYCEVTVIRELYHLGISSVYMSEAKQAYHLKQDRLNQIAVINFYAMNTYGTRYIYCPNDVTMLEALAHLCAVTDESKPTKTDGSHVKANQLIVRQFW